MVLNTLKLGIENGGFKEYSTLIIISTISFILIILLAYIFLKKRYSISSDKYDIKKQILFSIILLFSFYIHPFTKNLLTLYRTLNNSNNIQEKNNFNTYYKKASVKLSNNINKNLVFIYLESLEKTYFNNNFPNLITNLKSIMSKNNVIEFTNFVQMPGADYTIAGMVSSQCGTPLFAPYHGNSMSSVDKYYPGVNCIGDILKKSDYYLVFMQGSSTKFSGIDKFYKTHSFDEIYGRDNLLISLKDKKYLNGWGLYDDTLLPLVYNKFIELSKTKKKFALFTITIDTHHPNGQLSKSCQNDLYLNGNNPILNTVKCSDKLVSDFIKKIQNSNYAKNTLIVVMNDHLAMRNSAYTLLNKTERKNLLFIIDPSNYSHKKIYKPITHFDVAPTVLYLLGIKTQLGLGRNIFFSKSLVETVNNFKDKIYSWRENFIKFWNFATLPDTIDINVSNGTIYIGEHNYRLPILMKIKKNNTIEPFFERDVATKLNEQIKDFFEQGDEFIWIDQCYKIYNTLNKKPIFKREACIAHGFIEKESIVKKINNFYTYRVYNFNWFKFKINSYIKSLFKKRYIIIFNKKDYPQFLKRVEGLSHVEKWGRWSDANLKKSIVFKFKDKLPKSFKLTLFISAFGPNKNKKVEVIIGDKKKYFRLEANRPKHYSLVFTNINSNKIIITPPIPISPHILNMSKDNRKLGLGFIKITIDEI